MKRARVTADTFDKKPSAIDKLVGNTELVTTERPASEQLPQEAEQEKKLQGTRTYKPTSFYLDNTQLDKLDDLVHEFKKRTGKRINRNDIVRALIDQTDIGKLVISIR